MESTVVTLPADYYPDPDLLKTGKVVPHLCTYYYGFNTQAPFVDDVRVRRALSMAIDRQSLVDTVLKGGHEPAQWFSRPGLAGAPTLQTHPDLGIKYDLVQAKKLLGEYLVENDLTVNELDITVMFSTMSSRVKKIAEAIQQMWKDNLGLDIKLTWDSAIKTSPWKAESNYTLQLWQVPSWCGNYPDANNFIYDAFAKGGWANPGEGGINYANPEWEELLGKAAKERDPQKRVELYAQAEQTLVYTDAVIIPIYWYTQVALTQPWVKRTFSVTGHERYEKWEILTD